MAQSHVSGFRACVLAVVASRFFSRRELRGILSGQGSTAPGSEQIVDVPVPQGRREVAEGVQGSLPVQNSAAVVEQSVDIPARGGLQGFRPGQGSTASSSSRLLHDERIQRFFRTFPRPKKSAEVPRQSSARVPASLSPSELSSHQMAPPRESDESGEDETGDALSAALRLYGGCGGGRGERGPRRRRCNCAADRGDSCGGRPCAVRRQVPAVYELELKAPQIQFILSLPDHSCRATGTRAHSAWKSRNSTVPVQFLGAVGGV